MGRSELVEEEDFLLLTYHKVWVISPGLHYQTDAIDNQKI